MKENSFDKNIKKIFLALICLSGAVYVFASTAWNANNLGKMLSVRTTVNQSIYQMEDRENMTMPDAYIRKLIRDKNVTLPYEVKPYSDYDVAATEEERGTDFNKDYYIENNYTRYFNLYSNRCGSDNSLPTADDLTAFIYWAHENGGSALPDTAHNQPKSEVAHDEEEFLSLSKKDTLGTDFIKLGCTNDMLRYSFLLNQEKTKETAYFWYSWYYLSYAQMKGYYAYAYIQDGCAKADNLVAIWDRRENIYIMTKDYYRNSFLKDYTLFLDEKNKEEK